MNLSKFSLGTANFAKAYGVKNEKAKQGEYISSWNEFKWVVDTLNAMKILAKKGFKF